MAGINTARDFESEDHGVDKAIAKFGGVDQGKSQKLIEDLTKANQELRGNRPELRILADQLEAGQINTPQELKQAEKAAKGIIEQECSKILGKTVEKGEEGVLGHSKNVMRYISGLSISDAAKELKDMQENQKNQEKHRKNVEKLKTKSPRAYKAYIKELKRAKDKGSFEKSTADILKDTEKQFARAIKAPMAVQGTFFKQVEKGDIDSDDYNKVLDKLERDCKKLTDKYVKLLDPKIFGEEPAKEFEEWIKDASDMNKLEKYLHQLKSDYIPKRQRLQAEFEDLPEEITTPHQKKWYKELGYSERKSLMLSLKSVEHAGRNPLAQGYLKAMTDNPKEFASDELALLTNKFLLNSYDDQNTLLHAFNLTELKDRKELTKRFESLPDALQDENDDFWNMRKEDKIVMLRHLEDKKQEVEDEAIIDKLFGTQEGQSAFNTELMKALSTARGRSVQATDVVMNKIQQDQRKLGKVNIEDRQTQALHNKAGEQTAEKLDTLHDLSGGKETVDIDTGKTRKIKTIDLKKVNDGSMDTSQLAEVERELRESGVTSSAEDRTAPMQLIDTRGSGLEKNYTKNEEREPVKEMVQELLAEALAAAAESLGLATQKPANNNDLFDKADAERQRQILSAYQEHTKHRFHGLEGVTTDARLAG